MSYYRQQHFLTTTKSIINVENFPRCRTIVSCGSIKLQLHYLIYLYLRH